MQLLRVISLASLALISVSAVTVSGCAAPFYERWAARRGNEAVDVFTENVLGSRESEVLRPRGLRPGDLEDLESGGLGSGDAAGVGLDTSVLRDPVDLPFPPEHLLELTLLDSLRVAIRNNRDYKSRREALFLQGLSHDLTRHDFGPILASTFRYLFSDDKNAPGVSSETAGASVSQILPHGGTLAASLSGSAVQEKGTTTSGADTSTFSSAMDVSINQPLLQGAGRAISHERLIQAERNLVYEVRSFELFRQDFTIALMDEFYRLVASKETVTNQKESAESLEFQLEKARALRDVGRQNLVEVLNAESNYLSAKNDVLTVEENYRNDLDRFKIRLGLPVTMEIAVADEQPAFVDVPELNFEEAVRCALFNRLDFSTSRDQVEDAQRALDIAENNLLPAVDLDLGYSLSTDTEDHSRDLSFAQRGYSAGVFVEIPLDRWSERNSFVSSRIGLDQIRRRLSRERDDIIDQIRRGIRRLVRAEESIDLARRSVVAREKEKERAEFLIAEGQIDNRRFTDAQNNLTLAKNRLVATRVDHEIARVQLLRDLGILFLDEDGMVKE